MSNRHLARSGSSEGCIRVSISYPLQVSHFAGNVYLDNYITVVIFNVFHFLSAEVVPAYIVIK